jgi:hypothetical protein
MIIDTFGFPVASAAKHSKSRKCVALGMNFMKYKEQVKPKNIRNHFLACVVWFTYFA